MCQLLNIIILCPIIYLDYFWCIEYQYMHKYMKIGKRNGKRKKKRNFPANWAGGDFGPAGAWAHARTGRRPSLARQRGMAWGRHRGRGTHARGRGRLKVSGSWTGEGGNPAGVRKNRPLTRFRGGSPPWSRFWVIREVVKHGWV